MGLDAISRVFSRVFSKHVVNVHRSASFLVKGGVRFGQVSDSTPPTGDVKVIVCEDSNVWSGGTTDLSSLSGIQHGGSRSSFSFQSSGRNGGKNRHVFFVFGFLKLHQING